jgi:hypothetical protein
MSEVAAAGAVVGYSRFVTVNCADSVWVQVAVSIAKFRGEVWQSVWVIWVDRLSDQRKRY